MGKVRAYLSRGRDLAARWVQLWNQQRPARHAAAPAYYSMFALAPILYVVLRMATRFFSDPLVIDAVHAALNSLLGRLAGCTPHWGLLWRTAFPRRRGPHPCIGGAGCNQLSRRRVRFRHFDGYRVSVP